MRSTGKRVKFDQVDAGVGVFKSDNPGELSDIDTAIQTRTGGVTEISAAQYDSLLKKKETWLKSPPKFKWREELSNPLAQDTASVRPKEVVAVAEPVEVEPAKAPTQSSKPRIGRR